MPPGLAAATERGTAGKLQILRERQKQLRQPARSSGASAGNSTLDGRDRLSGREAADRAASSTSVTAAAAASSAAHQETLAHAARLEVGWERLGACARLLECALFSSVHV